MNRLLQALDPVKVNSDWEQARSILQSTDSYYFEPVSNAATGQTLSSVNNQQLTFNSLSGLVASLLKETEIVLRLDNDLEIMFSSPEVIGIDDHVPQNTENLPAEYLFFERYLEIFTLVLNGKHNKALLVPIEFPKECCLKYTKVVILKVLLIRAIAYEIVGQIKDALETYNRASHYVADVITHSKEATIWAEFLYYRFCLLATDTVGNEYYKLGIDVAITDAAFDGYEMIINHFSEYKLLARRTNMPVLELLYYSNQFKQYHRTSSVGEKIDELNKIIQARLVTSPDELFLEQYIDMQQRLHNLPAEVLLPEIIDISKKTFQSTVIARCLTLTLLDLGKHEEALQSYALYWKYNLKRPDRPRDIVYLHERLSELESQIGRDLETKMAFSLRNYTKYDKANAYSVIARAFEKTDKQKAGEFYSKSISAHSPNIIPDTSLRYGILQAKNHHSGLFGSLHTVRAALQKWDNDVRLWHLLALVLSSLGEDEKAMIAIEKALELLDEIFQKLGVGTKIKFNGLPQATTTTDKNWRERYIEVKWTQLALIEKQDLDQALVKIPAVFNLYYKLYGEDLRDQETANGLSHSKKKRQSIVTRTLSKTFTRTVEASRTLSGKKKHKQSESTSAVTSKENTEELRILNTLWLRTASLYRRAELYIEAEKAIIQAETLVGPTNQSHIELGYLILRSRPRLAMNEFEKVLEADRTNLAAIIGFATLAYGTADETIIANSTASGGRLFGNEFDRQGLLQRSLALLQTALTTAESSEAWLLLGELREVDGDIDGAIKAYENCESIESRRSVRDYGVAFI
jgi:tetratricopeptide (TPR) repeat protein